MAEAQPYGVPKQVVWDAVGLDWKSRMRRESHVRFREGLGVKFPRATRLVIFGERHLRHLLKEFIEHHMTERHHQGIGSQIIAPRRIADQRHRGAQWDWVSVASRRTAQLLFPRGCCISPRQLFGHYGV
jgi:hypothetical protein